MSKRIQPTGKQKTTFLIHFIIYAVATVLQLTMYNKGATSWVYPWPAWTVAAWGLALIGHWCAVYRSYEDKGHDEYTRQAQNG